MTYTAQFFKKTLARSYASAQRIVPLVRDVVPARSVLDVGCGKGDFLLAFREAGAAEILGIDGDYVPKDQLAIEDRFFRSADLRQALDVGRQYDLVVSLEVAEHLPPESAVEFVSSLVRHGSVILFSAAIPDQGGTGHVNEQWPSYWAGRFARLGYLPYDIVRPVIWQDKTVSWWYRQNTLLFADANGVRKWPRFRELKPAAPETLDLVHPDLYLRKLRSFEEARKNFQGTLDYLATGSLFEVSRSDDGRLNINRKV
jgi:SAM-dependent methyltransferase